MSAARESWLDGRRLHLLEWGDPSGAPLLLVHGVTGSAQDWAPFAARAGSNVRLVAPDLRGHGHSAHAEGETYEHLDYIADLLLVIEALGAPVGLVGHSIGGHVCMILAALRPDLAASLVLVDIEAFPPRSQPEVLRRLGEHPHPVFADTEAVVDALRALMPGVPESILRAKAKYDTVSQDGGTLVYRFDRGVLRRVTAPDARPYLSRISCPVLLVRGVRSSVMRAAAARMMTATIPRASLIEIAAATHWPHLENIDQFARAVSGFASRGVDLDITTGTVTTVD